MADNTAQNGCNVIMVPCHLDEHIPSMRTRVLGGECQVTASFGWSSAGARSGGSTQTITTTTCGFPGRRPTPATTRTNGSLAAHMCAVGPFLLCPVMCHVVALWTPVLRGPRTHSGRESGPGSGVSSRLTGFRCAFQSVPWLDVCSRVGRAAAAWPRALGTASRWPVRPRAVPAARRPRRPRRHDGWRAAPEAPVRARIGGWHIATTPPELQFAWFQRRPVVAGSCCGHEDRGWASGCCIKMTWFSGRQCWCCGQRSTNEGGPDERPAGHR
jgi:hypothetical protein